jgi:F0F1-type ATP synthase assembly protein I
LNVLRDNLGKTYKKVALLQAVIGGLLIFIAGLAAGGTAAISAAAGGLAVICGTAIYASLARESALQSVSAGKVMGRHLAAEFAKVLTIVVLMLLALASGWFAAGWLVVAMGVVLFGHWLALLIIR